MSDILKELQDYLHSASAEDLKKDYEELREYDSQGLWADELFSLGLKNDIENYIVTNLTKEDTAYYDVSGKFPFVA